MVLDTFMYLDYKDAKDGLTLKEIVEDLQELPDYGGGGAHYGEYTVLREAAQNEEIGSLEICCQSANMGYDSGTAACTFKSSDGSGYYVVYRGTGDGEWPDNGIGMTAASTLQQNRALSYFEEVVETLDIGKEKRLVVTGHSKGGNKAQFVAMETKHENLVDACYSVDGQGFSEAAVNGWKDRYGEEGYEKRREKLYGIHGENDYVSVLGSSILLAEHIRYIRTPVEKANFAGYHDIKYMFASLTADKETGQNITTFHGRKNSDAPGRGELGEYAAALSSGMMKLAPEERDGCAAVIMQIMEAAEGRKNGINGEKLTLADLKDFTIQGIPLIAESLFGEEEGRSFLNSLLERELLTGRLPAGFNLQADYFLLYRQAEEIKTLALRIEKTVGEVRETAGNMPLYIKGHAALYHGIKLSAIEIDKIVKAMFRIADFQGEAAESYRKWDNL
ncbi:MAG: DUF2974 domain-containing protein [Clostridium sp.]|nr:DUF2974 domain-containing protein [Clostridium sp.]